MKASFLILLFIVSLLTGCDLFNTDPKKPSGELMPLAVGNFWEYDFTYLGSIKDTLRYEVVKEIQVPWGDTSYTAYAFNLVPFPPDAPEYYWLYRNGEAGLYMMGGIADTDTLVMNQIEKWYPAEEGQTWDVQQLAFSRDSLKFYVSDTLQITLIDDDREIDTPAGTFNCFVYKFKIDFYEGPALFTTWDYFMYYRSGIGLVAQISTMEDDPEDIKEEMYLMNYKVN